MRAMLAAGALALATLAFGQAGEVAHPDPRVEERLRTLGEELRCLVCQNQTIADSNAPLALDLRNQIRAQIGAGRSDGEIRDYMVQRYGDFVLYKPPFKASTLVLWLGPFVLLAAGALTFAAIVKRRRAQPPAPPTSARRAEIEALLEEPGAASRASPTSAGRPSGKR
jgi:cytochrome c-type biogenesis protein CcmH